MSARQRSPWTQIVPSRTKSSCQWQPACTASQASCACGMSRVTQIRFTGCCRGCCRGGRGCELGDIHHGGSRSNHTRGHPAGDHRSPNLQICLRAKCNVPCAQRSCERACRDCCRAALQSGHQATRQVKRYFCVPAQAGSCGTFIKALIRCRCEALLCHRHPTDQLCGLTAGTRCQDIGGLKSLVSGRRHTLCLQISGPDCACAGPGQLFC